jgi:hypothetical protein
MAIGTLEEIIDDDHAIVSGAGGGESYVTIMSFVDKDLLEPGCSILMNHKSNAVIGVLGDDVDPAVNVMKLDKAPTESYADIGGLESQIQEIRRPSIRVSISHADPRPSLSAGIRRTPFNPPRAVRRDGYPTPQGCHPLWCTRYRKDPFGESRRQPNLRYVLEDRGIGIDSEIPWRRT